MIVEQISSGGTVTYLHPDQAGSTRLLTGSSGTVTEKCTYSAYGTPTSAEPRVALKHRNSGSGKSFIWSATRDGWLYLADLTQPLCTDGVGHHYLTDDEDDDALIELSFGEHDPQKIARLTKDTQHRSG